jgi:molybdopterin-guanine dinucleotide biosynthesis protein A
VTAIVLAGGRASRFGGPKLAIQLDGVALLDRAIAAVAAVADEIIIAGPARPTRPVVPGISIRSVVDSEPLAGPLVALAGALHASHGSLAVIVGGDMPRLQPDVLAAMLTRLDSDIAADAVILAAPAATPGEPPASPESPKRQVLPLALRVASVAPAVARTVAAGDRSLVRLLGRLRCVEIPAADWLALDPAAETLLDVDRPEDLERLRGSDLH